MAVDFSAFDKKVDLDALQEEVKNADLSSFEDVPDGTYIAVSYTHLTLPTTPYV